MEISFMKKKAKQKEEELVSQGEVEELAAEIAQMQDA
jgi:hypothetical protein